jgi:hypothetical protein
MGTRTIRRYRRLRQQVFSRGIRTSHRIPQFLQPAKRGTRHARQKARGIRTGLIGVWSCLESCTTFRAKFDPVRKFPQLHPDYAHCKHLYFYFDHADYGFCGVRLQTWFPFSIQIALNGREWLRRSLDRRDIGYGNF